MAFPEKNYKMVIDYNAEKARSDSERSITFRFEKEDGFNNGLITQRDYYHLLQMVEAVERVIRERIVRENISSKGEIKQQINKFKWIQQ